MAGDKAARGQLYQTGVTGRAHRKQLGLERALTEPRAQETLDRNVAPTAAANSTGLAGPMLNLRVLCGVRITGEKPEVTGGRFIFLLYKFHRTFYSYAGQILPSLPKGAKGMLKGKSFLLRGG